MKKIKFSFLVISDHVLIKFTFKPPKTIRLKNHIVYITLKTTLLADKINIKKFLSTKLMKIINSPIKLNVNGVPTFAKQKINKYIENKGIRKAKPP